MRVGFLYNPISGKGLAQRLALDCGAALEQAGFGVVYFQSQPTYSEAQALEILTQLEALIVCGGDGTIQSLLPFLAKTKVPVAMLPSGVENLFARNFGMTSEPQFLLAVLKKAQRNRPETNSESTWWREHFFAFVGDRPFFTMASIGFDASVVHEISKRRSGKIGHLGYVAPTLRVLKAHQSPQLTVTVDGQPWLKDQRGYLIIANTPQYALRVPWVPEASSTEPNLTARFLPYETGFDFIKLALSLKLGGKINQDIQISGQLFEIAAAVPKSEYAVQADGDFVGQLPCRIRRAKDSLRIITF